MRSHLLCAIIGSTLLLPPAAAAQVVPAAAIPPGAGPWTGPRTPDGQPDIKGTYVITGPGGTFSLENPMAGGGRFPFLAEGKPLPRNPSRVVDPADGLVPYRSEAKARRDALEARAEDPQAPHHIDTQMRCLLPGPLRGTYRGQSKFVQFPGVVLILSTGAGSDAFRIIRLNAEHPSGDLKLWMGDSVGRWEGNTLVVDVANLNAKGRLSMIGDYYTTRTKVVERFTFAGPDIMHYRATLDDPTIYTRPWTIGVATRRDPAQDGEEAWEDGCHEGERTSRHLDETFTSK